MPPDTHQPQKSRFLSDAEIAALVRFRDGERTPAFQDLVRPHLGAMRALARRLTGEAHWADDLVQESLVRVFHGLGGFRGEAGFRTWVLQILVRLSKQPARWRRGERAGSLDFDVPDVLDEGPEHRLVARELRDRLDEAVERLTPRQRAAFHLRAVEGMDYGVIAATLECSNAAARMLVLGARRSIMARLGRHLEP